MTVQTVPYALQNAAHSAAVFRQSASAGFAGGGVIYPTELALSAQATPNMSVVLGPGRAKVAGTNVSPPSGMAFTIQGMYDVLNDAPVTLTVAAASSTNPRIDAVYIGVQDSFYSGSSNQAVAGIVTGTPAATPVAPSIPSSSLLLGYIAVAANATSIVAANISQAGLLAGSIAGITVQRLVRPSGQTPSSGTADWFAFAPVVVPQWATQAIVDYSIVGALLVTNTTAATSVAPRIGSAFGTLTRLMDPSALNVRFGHTVIDQITGLGSLSGSQTFAISATYSAGTGVYRVDSNSTGSASIQFLP